MENETFHEFSFKVQPVNYVIGLYLAVRMLYLVKGWDKAFSFISVCQILTKLIKVITCRAAFCFAPCIKTPLF